MLLVCKADATKHSSCNPWSTTPVLQPCLDAIADITRFGDRTEAPLTMVIESCCTKVVVLEYTWVETIQ